MSLMDVGCGPGSITVELAEMVAPGRVYAFDVSETAVQAAQAAVDEGGHANVEVAHGSVYEMGDERFDVIYAHQVLQHLTDPVSALERMRQRLNTGGIVAVRDSDYAAMFWAPTPPALDRWRELYHEMNRRLGLESCAGRWLPTWLAAAGFNEITVTSSTWTHATPDARAIWGGAWKTRVLESSYAEHALSMGLATPEELREISDAFTWWSEQPNAMWVVTHVEVVGRA
jgi:trans-aconitate methyltransferase